MKVFLGLVECVTQTCAETRNAIVEYVPVVMPTTLSKSKSPLSKPGNPTPDQEGDFIFFWDAIHGRKKRINITRNI